MIPAIKFGKNMLETHVIQFWLKVGTWNDELVQHALAAGINGLYVPTECLKRVTAMPGILSVSTDDPADLVIGRDVGEVLVTGPDTVSAVARHHGAIPTIVYCTDWNSLRYSDLIEKSGRLL